MYVVLVPLMLGQLRVGTSKAVTVVRCLHGLSCFLNCGSNTKVVGPEVEESALTIQDRTQEVLCLLRANWSFWVRLAVLLLCLSPSYAVVRLPFPSPWSPLHDSASVHPVGRLVPCTASQAALTSLAAPVPFPSWARSWSGCGRRCGSRSGQEQNAMIEEPLLRCSGMTVCKHVPLCR